MKYTLRKSEVLRGQKHFSIVFQQGKKIEGTFLRCFYAQSDPHATEGNVRCQVGFSVSKNVRRAVDRNRMKRLLRESYRRNKEILTTTSEGVRLPRAIVLLFSRHVKKASELPSFTEVQNDVRDLLQKLVRETSRT